MKTKVKIEKVGMDLMEIFKIGEPGVLSTSDGTTFHILKQEWERGTVLGILRTYFDDKVVEEGYLTVGAITLVTTTFEIKEGHPPGVVLPKEGGEDA